jgi:hypothetical protein
VRVWDDKSRQTRQATILDIPLDIVYIRSTKPVIKPIIVGGNDVSTQIDPNSAYTKPDGTTVYDRADGTTVFTRADGTAGYTKPDGTTVLTEPDGTTVYTKPDGSTVFNDGTTATVITKSDGTTGYAKPVNDGFDKYNLLNSAEGTLTFGKKPNFDGTSNDNKPYVNSTYIQGTNYTRYQNSSRAWGNGTYNNSTNNTTTGQYKPNKEYVNPKTGEQIKRPGAGYNSQWQKPGDANKRPPSKTDPSTGRPTKKPY